jgi:hypothetical protein
MGLTTSKLFHDKPFPANAGPTQAFRKIERNKPACGPSAMPHKQTPVHYPPLDAMGRVVVEDGTGRLRAGWPASFAGVCTTAFKADFIFDMMLWNTEKLNEYMIKNKMLAFCIIGEFKVVQLINVPYEEACSRLPQTAARTMADAAAMLPPGPNRLSESQLQEVVARLMAAYLEYGVGALIMEETGWKYQVMVPNEKEYLRHKDWYDAGEDLCRAQSDRAHKRTKATRSGKKYDIGAPVHKKKREGE